MLFIRRPLIAVLTLATMLVAVHGVRANTLTPSDPTSVQQLGPHLYKFFYDVDFTGTTATTNLKTNDSLNISNFLGYNGVAGVTATTFGPWTTNATATDVTFTYTGAPTLSPPKLKIFSFFIETTVGTVDTNDNASFRSLDHNGSKVQTTNGNFNGAAVPEMSTIALFGGLLATGSLTLLRRRVKRA